MHIVSPIRGMPAACRNDFLITAHVIKFLDMYFILWSIYYHDLGPINAFPWNITPTEVLLLFAIEVDIYLLLLDYLQFDLLRYNHTYIFYCTCNL
jgi:hypothetical protein